MVKTHHATQVNKLLVFIWLAAAAFSTNRYIAGETIVYVVRHAEKATDRDPHDPPLTEAGRKRAEALSVTLRSVPLKAIYATEMKRTQETVEPTVKRIKTDVTVIERRKVGELASRLKTHHEDEAVLVAGHSNTIPQLLKALGVKKEITFKANDYDNLFVVVLRKEKPPVFLTLHYGTVTE